MKNKKGFTLIELLAIIVILAIIAVITVPIILNIIENSKKGAATDSAYGFKDAVNKAYVQELAKPNNGSLKLDGTYVVQSDGTLNADTGSTFGVTGYANLPVSLSGDKPSSGKLRYSNNVLNAGCLVIGDYKVIFKGGNATSTTKGDCSDYEYSSEQGNGGSLDNHENNTQAISLNISTTLNAITASSDGAKYLTTAVEVYYNPTTGEICNSSDSVSTLGTTTGCMHWYLYSVKGEYANMILDHNITEMSAENGKWAIADDYNSSNASSLGITYPGVETIPPYGTSYGYSLNARGPVTALKTLKLLTDEWVAQSPKVPNSLSSNEHIITKDRNDNKYQIDYTGYKARLITKEEAEYLGCTTSSGSCPEWMTENVYYESGTLYDNVFGYWTSSTYASYPNRVWNVFNTGMLNFDNANRNVIGVRPVINVLLAN